MISSVSILVGFLTSRVDYTGFTTPINIWNDRMNYPKSTLRYRLVKHHNVVSKTLVY